VNFSGAKKSIAHFFARKPARRQDNEKTEKVENPYLSARRTWNTYVGSIVSSRQTWQVIGLLSMLTTLVAVGGLIYIGSQSKFVPYVVEVDKHGQVLAAGPVQATTKYDARIIHATVAEFISDARMVTPDAALQNKSVARLYAKLSPNDAATQKMNEWFNSTLESSPFKRAAKEMVSTEIKSVLPLSKDTWQVEWLETTRDRSGMKQGKSLLMRAAVTVYFADNLRATEEQFRLNPMGIYVRDFSWSRLSQPEVTP
jgi:type IV secretion system protein VirB5